MREVPDLRKAFEIEDRANSSREELEYLEKREIFIHDRRNAIQKALQQGLEQGLQQGLQQGRGVRTRSRTTRIPNRDRATVNRYSRSRYD